MPTGYTAGVVDGSVTDLKTFAMTAARAMGALVMMRDEPFSAPIPDRFEPSSYHTDKLKELRAEQARLMALDDAGIEAELNREAQEYADRKAEDYREHHEIRARYDAMIEKVEAWQGAPEGLKSFCLQQLRDGRDFDAREPYHFWGTAPENDPSRWYVGKLEQVQKEIDYHEKNHREEVERVEARNEWIKQLKESLND